MIILSFLCTGIRAVNQEDLDSKEVPEIRDSSPRRTSYCGQLMGILLLRRPTGSILYICLYFPTSAMVMYWFINYLEFFLISLRRCCAGKISQKMYKAIKLGGPV